MSVKLMGIIQWFRNGPFIAQHSLISPSEKERKW
jgi:hypothetical protein